MTLVPFVYFFREQAEAEVRTLTILGHQSLPDDQYDLVEFYCADPACDCRRVTLCVFGLEQGDDPLASIGFGFDRDAKFAGPYLDVLSPQSRYAQTFLQLVTEALGDKEYVARLESHYQQVKEAVADPTHPVHKAGNGAERE
jgi:hypothetical protein